MTGTQGSDAHTKIYVEISCESWWLLPLCSFLVFFFFELLLSLIKHKSNLLWMEAEVDVFFLSFIRRYFWLFYFFLSVLVQ